MNFCAIQTNSFAACEEVWATVTAGKSVGKRETVVCPKPRRLGLAHSTLEPSYSSPIWWHVSHQQEDCDSRAGNELLDVIFAQGNCGNSEQSQPPFFSGSPPDRVSNPIIQDEHFGDEKYSPMLSHTVVYHPGPTMQSPSSNRKGGCVVRPSFGNNPVVRVEGFDCVGWDRRNCSVPTLA